MENESKTPRESQSRVKAEGIGARSEAGSGRNSGESKTKNEKEAETSKRHILRVYNVPPEFTPLKLREVVEESCSGAQILDIVAPNPWDDKIDTCWVLICKDPKTYNSLLSLEDVWLRLEKSDKVGTSISFLAGDELDLSQVNSKLDEQLLLNDLN